MRKWLWGLLVLVLAACNNDDGLKFEDLPAGDATRGEQIFSQHIEGASACNTCHIVGESSAAPDLTGYGARAGSRVDGESAEQYTLNSIITPAKHIVDGYSNLMPRNYEKALSEQQLADLIAYVLSQ